MADNLCIFRFGKCEDIAKIATFAATWRLSTLQKNTFALKTPRKHKNKDCGFCVITRHHPTCKQDSVTAFSTTNDTAAETTTAAATATTMAATTKTTTSAAARTTAKQTLKWQQHYLDLH
jgi:hypothetical protein